MTRTGGADEVGGAAVAGPADCTEALSRLFEFLDSEVAEADADRIRQHLADCEPCLSEFDVEHQLKRLVRRSCSEVAPVQLHVRIRQQLTVLRVELRDCPLRRPEGRRPESGRWAPRAPTVQGSGVGTVPVVGGAALAGAALATALAHHVLLAVSRRAHRVGGIHGPTPTGTGRSSPGQQRPIHYR